MTVPTIFDTCRPREDVLKGAIAEADFAADLAQVIVGKGSAEYLDPVRFFAHTWPTRGLKNLLANVCRRLSGSGGEVAAIHSRKGSEGSGLRALRNNLVFLAAEDARKLTEPKAPRVGGMGP